MSAALAKKLGIKPLSRVGSNRGIGHLLPDVALEHAPWDVYLGFATDAVELDAVLAIRDQLTTAGGLWVCWPKGSSPLPSEIGREDVRAAGLLTGWVDNKVCAVDDHWSGLRFVRRVADR